MKEIREFENREQTARQRLDIIREQGANCSKWTGEFENREQTARKKLENLRTRRNLLERHYEKGSKPLERE